MYKRQDHNSKCWSAGIRLSLFPMNLDLRIQNRDRLGYVQTGKETVSYTHLPHLVKIYQTLTAEGIDVLGTRASREQYEAVKEMCIRDSL